MPRSEVAKMLADKLGIGVRTARHKISQWLDLQMLRMTGSTIQQARGGPKIELVTTPN